MGNTALHFCTEYGYDALGQYLIQKGANPEIKSIKGHKASEGINKK